MELEDVIKRRRSIRKYNNVPVSNEEIISMIDAAIWAPSACNFQLWKFIVIDDDSIIRNIQIKGAADFLKSVHQCILVLYDNQTDNLEYLDYVESASAAIENMLLKATEIGVGTCWVNNLPNKKVLRAVLDIPYYYDPIAIVTMGHYDEEPKVVERKYHMDEIVSYNKWLFSDSSKRNNILLFLRRVARKMYKVLPFKRAFYRLVGKFEKKFDN